MNQAFESIVVQVIASAFLGDGKALPSLDLADGDWPFVLDAARAQGVSPLFYQALKTIGWVDQIPQAGRESLRSAFLLTSVANWRSFRELDSILADLAGAKIPVVLLKGCALANWLYPDIGLRPMSDLDILVPFAEAPRACEELAKRGYVPSLEPSDGFSWDLYDERVLSRQGQAPVIELHTHLLHIPYYRDRISMDWFWAHTVSITLNKQSVLILKQEAQLIHLASHLALHHQNRGMQWSFDLALLLARHAAEMDWDQIRQAAHMFGLSEVLRSSLADVQRLWRIAMPAGVQGLLTEQSTTRERILFKLTTATHPEATEVWDVFNMPGGSRKLEYIRQSLFPNRSYMVNRYRIRDDWFLPIHYVIRLVRGGLMLVRSAFSILLNMLSSSGRNWN